MPRHTPPQPPHQLPLQPPKLSRRQTGLPLAQTLQRLALRRPRQHPHPHPPVRQPPPLQGKPPTPTSPASSPPTSASTDDLDAIYTEIADRDDHVAALIRKYPGVRLMRQPDPWECLVSYICSARATPPRIAQRVETDSNPAGSSANPERRGPTHLSRPTSDPRRGPRPACANAPRLRPRPSGHHRGRPAHP